MTNTNSSGLETKAMLVRFSRHRWGAKKNSSEAEHEIAERKKADPDQIKVTKKLLKSVALNEIKKIQSQAKKKHRLLTLPWHDGVGMLPSELYFKYTEAMSAARIELDPFISKFMEEYTKTWNNGMTSFREGLGDMFDQNDYPEPAKVRVKFGITINFHAIQNPETDFRCNLSKSDTKVIQSQMNQDNSENIKRALKEPVERLHKVISKVEEKLKDSDAKFKDSLIGNVQELMEILPALNVMDDPKLNKFIAKTEKDICSVSDVKALRTDNVYRASVAKSATDILKSMKSYM